MSPADTVRKIAQIGHIPACPSIATHYTTKTSIQQAIFKINSPGPKKPPKNPIFMPNPEKKQNIKLAFSIPIKTPKATILSIKFLTLTINNIKCS
jgi:hypothetical protein